MRACACVVCVVREGPLRLHLCARESTKEKGREREREEHTAGEEPTPSARARARRRRRPAAAGKTRARVWSAWAPSAPGNTAGRRFETYERLPAILRGPTGRGRDRARGAHKRPCSSLFSLSLSLPSPLHLFPPFSHPTPSLRPSESRPCRAKNASSGSAGVHRGPGVTLGAAQGDWKRLRWRTSGVLFKQGRGGGLSLSPTVLPKQNIFRLNAVCVGRDGSAFDQSRRQDGVRAVSLSLG